MSAATLFPAGLVVPHAHTLIRPRFSLTSDIISFRKCRRQYGYFGNDGFVPAEAVQDVEGRPSVFVEEDGAFEARAVTLGERNAVEVQVLSGIEPGEPVVVKGAFTLKSELAKAEMGEGHAH